MKIIFKNGEVSDIKEINAVKIHDDNKTISFIQRDFNGEEGDKELMVLSLDEVSYLELS